ncbi:hypothetical protein EJB05_46448, partial [Eragrostis curvula]
MHLERVRKAAICGRCDEQDEAISTESQIRRILFYPDGTPKRGPNSPGRKNPNYRERHLVQVVLDQYNDDHNLFGDHAYQLNGDVKFHWLDEDERSLCLGCTESPKMKHPNNTDAYAGGHKRRTLRWLSYGLDWRANPPLHSLGRK